MCTVYIYRNSKNMQLQKPQFILIYPKHKHGFKFNSHLGITESWELSCNQSIVSSKW